MRGKNHMFAIVAGDTHFGNRRTPGVEQLKSGLPPFVQMFRGGLARPVGGHSELRGGCIVDQQETALLVLNGHAGRKQLENILQESEFAVAGGFAPVLRGNRWNWGGWRVLHGRTTLAKSLVVLVKWIITDSNVSVFKQATAIVINRTSTNRTRSGLQRLVTPWGRGIAWCNGRRFSGN